MGKKVTVYKSYVDGLHNRIHELNNQISRSNAERERWGQELREERRRAERMVEETSRRAERMVKEMKENGRREIGIV